MPEELALSGAAQKFVVSTTMRPRERTRSGMPEVDNQWEPSLLKDMAERQAVRHRP